MFAAMSMLLFLLLARTTSVELYGRWVIFMTANGLIDMVRVGLVGMGATRFISTSVGIEQNKTIGSAYYLNLFTTILLTVLLLPTYFILEPIIPDSYYLPVFLFYPLYAFFSLPHTQATTLNQGIMNFKVVMVIRGSTGLFNLVFIGIYILIADISLTGLIIMFCLSDLVVSAFVMVFKWDGLNHMNKIDFEKIKQLLHFGKYSTASSIGSTLLRSSDTFILSLSTTMGAQSVAILAIPFKIVELIEVPLRSFAATALPKFSNRYQTERKLSRDFNNYLFYSLVFLLPIIIILPFTSEWILHLFGGDRYASVIDTQKNIIYIITFYMLVLPFDRLIGVGLMAINRPDLNLYKLLIMLMFNISFDLIAVFVFESLEMVAIATVLFTLIGTITGWQMLSSNSDLTLSTSLKHFSSNKRK